MSKNTEIFLGKNHTGEFLKKTDDDVEFLKQVPVHPRDRLARKIKNEVKFLKQVLQYPRDRLKRKNKLENYIHLNKKK